MSSRHAFSVFFLQKISIAISLCLFLSSCALPQSKPQQAVKEPPLIPDPVAPQPKTEADANKKAPLIGAYPDLALTDENGFHTSQLREAIDRGLKMGALNPANRREEFSPEKAVAYWEFREWAVAYQKASKGFNGIIASMNLPGAKTLPSSLSWEERTLSPTRLITRQDLCALYVFLTNQQETARKLTPSNVENANPNHDNISMDEALSQFKDYANISGWAKRYIAITYQDGVLQKVFNLSPNQLTLEEGFKPKQQATRGEVILLLDSLYADNSGRKGKKLKLVPAKPAKTKTEKDPTTQTKPALPVAPIKPEKPVPLGHLKSVEETGPNGARNTMQINGPE